MYSRSPPHPPRLVPSAREKPAVHCRFYAFQFHLEELVDSLEELQAATTTLVRVMPRHARAARAAAASSLYPQPSSSHL